MAPGTCPGTPSTAASCTALGPTGGMDPSERECLPLEGMLPQVCQLGALLPFFLGGEASPTKIDRKNIGYPNL